MPTRFNGAYMVLLWVVTLSSVAMAQDSNKAFGPGEQSLYRIQYLGMTAGTAQVTVGAPMKQWGQQVLPIISLAKSDPALGVWPIKDKFVSYWHSEGQRSVGSDFFVDENNKRRRQRIQMKDGHTAQVVRQREGAEPTEATHELPEGAMDLTGATFALRNRGLADGGEYTYPVFTGSKSFMLRAKVDGREKIMTAMGEREVFRVKLRTEFSEKLQAKRDIIAYFTTDSTHVPVRIEAELALGSIVAELSDYKQGRLVAMNDVTGG